MKPLTLEAVFTLGKRKINEENWDFLDKPE
jgi:hypothetical protein